METSIFNEKSLIDHAQSTGNKQPLDVLIADKMETVSENAAARGISMLKYVKERPRHNVYVALLLHKIIEVLETHPNHGLLMTSADKEIDRLKSSPHFSNPYVEANVIREGNKIGRLGMIIHGMPTWVKPLTGNEYLHLKVRGVEIHYIEFLDLLATEKPKVLKYRTAILNLLKKENVKLYLDMRPGELILLLERNAQ